MSIPKEGKVHPLIPVIAIVVLISVICTVILYAAGDFVVYIPKERYRTYNVIYYLLWLFLVFPANRLARGFPRDENALIGKMAHVLFCGIAMIVLTVVLIRRSSLGSLILVSPMSDQMPILVISEGLSLFCFFFAVYCIELTRRILRRRRSQWL